MPFIWICLFNISLHLLHYLWGMYVCVCVHNFFQPFDSKLHALWPFNMYFLRMRMFSKNVLLHNNQIVINFNKVSTNTILLPNLLLMIQFYQLT